MRAAEHRFLIIADGQFGPLTSKTANSCIRYFPERIVAVLDRTHAGKTAQQVLGFGGAIPVVDEFERGVARGATAVLIGIAPAGGQLPVEWRGWLKSAIARLKPTLRDTVVLIAGQQLTHAEAAEVLGVAENTVAWRMHEARRLLAGD